MKVLFRAKTIKQDFKEETESLKCISGVWYAIGDILEDKYISIPESENVYFPDEPKVLLVLKAIEIDPTTLAIKMPERDFFMSLDIETGKGGDLLKDNEVLAWNGEMMNCSVIQFSNEGKREDYIIDLDNNDFDRLEVIGIQK